MYSIHTRTDKIKKDLLHINEKKKNTGRENQKPISR